MSNNFNLLYIVTKEGRFRHDIRGVFDSSDAAIARADDAAMADHDSYHEYCVYSIMLNDAAACIPIRDRPLYTVRKG